MQDVFRFIGDMGEASVTKLGGRYTVQHGPRSFVTKNVGEAMDWARHFAQNGSDGFDTDTTSQAARHFAQHGENGVVA